VTLVPELPRTRTSGATRWLTPQKALIQISFRYKTNDQFWFTFFHESAHILLHGKREIFLEDDKRGSRIENEQEADSFAKKILISEQELKKFVKSGKRRIQDIRWFADTIGVAPGIVVGRLQHDGVLPHSHCNGLKTKLDWKALLKTN
jgi:Zn-dependent peptidase ImmA (M78 family)